MGRNKISDVIGWKAIVLCTIGILTTPKMIVRSNATGDKMSNPQLCYYLKKMKERCCFEMNINIEALFKDDFIENKTFYMCTKFNDRTTYKKIITK